VDKNINISLITACKDRNKCLESVLPSWLQHKEIDEIVIVDWSSKESLDHLTKVDSRIKIVKVFNEKYYIPSQANNLAAHFASGKYILRMDTDYFLNPYYNFFENYKITDIDFVSGDPENPIERDNNPYFKYLFGLLFISKDAFNKVGGYNEVIGKYYSHEDYDIFARLVRAGFNQIKLKNNLSVIHIPHSDKKRYEYFEGGQTEYYNETNTVEAHIGLNFKKFKSGHFYVEPLNTWEINIQKNQIFYAFKCKNILAQFPSVNCISLAESSSRREKLKQQFQRYNIKNINFLISERFAKCNDVVTGKLSHTLSDGHKGCSVSHLKNIQNWLNNTEEEYGFFCEDDLSLETIQYWNKTWAEFLNYDIPNDWECVQLLFLKDNGNIKSLNLRLREWNDWGVTAYILKRDYAKKIVNSYCRQDTFCLELPEPNTDIQPLIENILFTNHGQVYACPMFVEDINHISTFCVSKDHNNDLHMQTHINSQNAVINLWKNKDKKIVDYCTFYEPTCKELLELRIHVLKDYVDEFIICESNKTQSGAPTPFKLKEVLKQLNLHELPIRVIELDIPNNENLEVQEIDRINCYDGNSENYNSVMARARERLQKDALLTILNEYDDNTVFIHSDIDEIINPKNIQFIANLVKNTTNEVIRIPLVHLEGRADLRVFDKNTQQPKNWTGMFFATKQHLLKATPTQIRSNALNPLSITFITENNKILTDLGWHFSWMGGPEIRKHKCKAFTHYDDSFSYLNTLKYNNKETEEFQNDLDLKEGYISPSGDKNTFLKQYSNDNLPKEIYTLPNVEQFLFPKNSTNNMQTNNNTELENLVKAYALNTEDGLHNFNLGVWYWQQEHTAPALSFFLRCSERAEDITLRYEALIWGSFCYEKQKTRDGTARTLLMHAVCLIPDRPEAYFLLSRFHERRQQWQDAYYYACRGLEYADRELQPLKKDVEYPGKYGLLFEKAVSGYWWGKNDESKHIFLDLKDNYELSDEYKKVIRDNLKQMGIEWNIDNLEQPIPVLGVPIVNGVHWLKRLIESIDYPVKELCIINNNGRDQITAELDEICIQTYKNIEKIRVVHMPGNLGVPGSWNFIIKTYLNAPYWVISNHDIAFCPGTLKEIVNSAKQPEVGMVNSNGSFEFFLIKDWVVQKCGLFDENLYPAYTEDWDYQFRMNKTGIKTHFIEGKFLHGEENYKTTGSQTWRIEQNLKDKLSYSRDVNELEYIAQKWGPQWLKDWHKDYSLSPWEYPFNTPDIPYTYTTFDLEFARKKYLGF